MEKTYLLLDVGGTEIKAGMTDGRGGLLGEILHYPSRAKEEKEVILDHISEIVKELKTLAGDTPVGGIGMAFPGPFDYTRGISLMKGLNKYDAIYGVSIEDEVKKRVPGLSKTVFCFLHDVEAFALGECWFGAAREADKLLCLCIGTGAGSAFIEKKKVLKEKKDGVPEHGWLYHTPYKDSIIDDYLSVRGLLRLSREIAGTELDGRQLYERCRNRDEKALFIYRLFGEELRECLLPFLDGFRPDCVVLGGQISKSFCYFGDAFRKECDKRMITVCLEPDTSARTMQGLFTAMKQRGDREC